ncbi:cytochrome P450 [Catenulispora sp. MAP5-51]|uniref:cytochrome P450 family protein n=1 Tax=Catenulispora sp. MAP5-51 TaxID=3156298 RepID=UPI0035124907
MTNGDGFGFEDVGEAFFRDQHAHYAQWRRRGGAQPIRFPGPLPLQGWVITRHADAKAALADPRLAKDSATERYAAYIGETSGGPGKALTAHMLNADPPEHTRLRKLVQKAYTARRIEELRPRIAELVDVLLDDLSGAREADLISRFALPLPIAVAFELFGGTGFDHAQFAVRGKSVDGGHGDGEVSVTSAEDTRVRIENLVAHKREHPGDDLLSALLAAEEDGDRLTVDEITSMAFLLVVAGHQTTVNLIANAVHTLLAHPDQLDKLRADPTLIHGAVQETLRFESSSALASLRYTTEPVTLAGTEIPAGEFVHVALMAANHDPAVFEDPERFDITRPPGGHLAFGHGIHRCLGAQLAVVQAEIALTRLFARFPKLRSARGERGRARWQANPRHRGLETLVVRLR